MEAMEDFDKYNKNDLVIVPWSGEDVLTVLTKYINYDLLRRLRYIQKGINYTVEQTQVWLGGILGIIDAIRKRIKWFTLSSVFDNSLMICVLMNTVILALDGIVTSASGLAILDKFNFSFTIIFTLDCGLKIIGMGPS